MDNDWHESINIDQHLYIMTVKANISHFCSNALLSFTLIAGILYILGEYVIRFVFLNEDYNNTLRQFPIRVQFPFETQQSPIFEFLAVMIFIYMMLHICTVASLNGLIFTLVIYILHIYFNFLLMFLVPERFITQNYNHNHCYI